jgi:hypothetical protein
MQGQPSDFEAIGSRLGFRAVADDAAKLLLVWQGARFPAFLCLGIALGLGFVSVPIVEALRQRGFAGPAASLWYFPVMNLVLLGIAAFLLSVKRTIAVDKLTRAVTLTKRSLLHRVRLSVNYDEIAALRVAADQVYSGFALAGSSAAETYPVASLRLVLKDGATVLMDRGGRKRLEELAARVAGIVGKPVDVEMQQA